MAKEFVEQDGETHALHPLLDTTLCGMALEGDEPPAWKSTDPSYGGFAVATSSRSKVLTCDSCVRIVRAARAIPLRSLGK